MKPFDFCDRVGNAFHRIFRQDRIGGSRINRFSIRISAEIRPVKDGNSLLDGCGTVENRGRAGIHRLFGT